MRKGDEAHNLIIIDDDGNTLKSDIFYKNTHGELKRLGKEVTGITNLTLEWQNRFKDVDQNIELINNNLKEIKKSIPVKFSKRLANASRVSNDLMGLGKIIFIVIVVIILWTSAASFKDVILGSVLPNNTKIDDLNKKMELLIIKLDEHLNPEQ